MIKKEWVKTVTHLPGVYRMLDAEGSVLYVGKARNLKKRLLSYFRPNNTVKTLSMMSLVETIEITVTHTENEALILEANLIKSLRPRYNILLRDDKTYPYIIITTDTDFPRIDIYRGTRHKQGQFFGPYPSASSAREALNTLQKCFPLRQCKDSYFANRSRPCLQHQIGRCPAPCVGLISKDDYQREVTNAMLFLKGKNQDLIHELTRRMQEASQALKFELAAKYRDQIQKLRPLQEQQNVLGGYEDLDVLAVAQSGEMSFICLLTVRQGRCLGSRSHRIKQVCEESETNLLLAFMTQYYLNENHQAEIPPLILLANQPESHSEFRWLESALTELSATPVKIRARTSLALKVQWQKMALQNAQIALETHQSTRAFMRERFETLSEVFGETIERVECFDISHTMGEATVASCVVFNTEGPLKSDYRIFNIKDIQAGDDYAAMKQVLSRRYADAQDNPEKLPDLILIDGGKGQLKQAIEIMVDYHLAQIHLLGVAKGPERKAGLEDLILPDGSIIPLPQNSPARLLIQQIRDEAHRFAITGHKTRRAKARRVSQLEQIEGVGPKRRKALLAFFGGIRGLKGASVQEIMKVEGINHQLAMKIWQALQDN